MMTKKEKVVKKYKLLRKESKKESRSGDTTVYRIEALRDFSYYDAMCGVIRTVRCGDKGGWLQSEKNLSHEGNCWVAHESVVCGKSLVCGDAVILHESFVGDFSRVQRNSCVAGLSSVKDNALVSDNTKLIGRASIYGNAFVLDSSMVLGDAMIGSNVTLQGNSVVSGRARLSGNVRLNGRSVVSGCARVSGDVSLEGESFICGDVFVEGKIKLCGKVVISDKAHVTGNLVFYGTTHIGGDALITGIDDIIYLGPFSVMPEYSSDPSYLTVHRTKSGGLRVYGYNGIVFAEALIDDFLKTVKDSYGRSPEEAALVENALLFAQKRLCMSSGGSHEKKI
jgi:UDP-3-O-[3-hydroxymyristoyl] glucosamine N-acyltransferase